MAFELKDGQGTLHVNDKEGKDPNFPDRSGTINIGGTMYRLAGWLKTSNNGHQWLSLEAKVKDNNNNATVPF